MTKEEALEKIARVWPLTAEYYRGTPVKFHNDPTDPAILESNRRCRAKKRSQGVCIYGKCESVTGGPAYCELHKAIRNKAKRALYQRLKQGRRLLS